MSQIQRPVILSLHMAYFIRQIFWTFLYLFFIPPVFIPPFIDFASPGINQSGPSQTEEVLLPVQRYGSLFPACLSWPVAVSIKGVPRHDF